MCLAQRRNGVEGGGALCHQPVDLIRIRVVDTKLTALLQEPPGNSPSHAPQPNDSNLHVFSSPKNHSSCACACVRWHPCALACSRLVDHPCDCGSRMRMPSMSGVTLIWQVRREFSSLSSTNSSMLSSP